MSAQLFVVALFVYIKGIEGTTLLPLDNGNYMFCIKLIDLMNYYYEQIQKEEKERKLVI